VELLAEKVNAARKDLTALLGPGGVERIDALLEQYRHVPPTMAYKAFNIGMQGIVSAVTGGLGAVTGSGFGPVGMAAGGTVGALGGVAMKELAQNWHQLARTPESLKQFMNIVALGARAGVSQARNE
jgi:hypothetical protein